jgi:hypothetical protein
MYLNLTLREMLLLTAVVALFITLLIHRYGVGSHVHKLPFSATKDKLYLRVIAADDYAPVANVDVSLTWVGKGCDGGSHASAVSDRNGVVYLPNGFIPGPIQVYLTPPKGTRFQTTAFTEHPTMLTCRPDGTYYPSVFRIEINQSSDPDFLPH